MICPLKNINIEIIDMNCDKEKCGWFNTLTHECGIIAISKELREMHQ